MKKLSLALIAAASMISASWAGSIGPGPWANGAYFPGQFDGLYSASAFGTNGLVGVIGFGLRNGSPSVSTNSTLMTNGTQNTIGLDPFQNYFAIFIDGETFVGPSIANINVDAKQVTGALMNGSGPQFTLAVTNSTVDTNGVIHNEVTFQQFVHKCSGSFTAKLDSKKAVVTFTGDETGKLAILGSGTTNTFSVNGIKVSNDSSPSYGQPTSGGDN